MLTLSWQDVLDLQIRTSEWLGSADGLEFGAGYWSSAWRDRAKSEHVPGANIEQAARAGALWAKGLGADTFNAEPIYVEGEMMTVVESAVSGFVPEALLETDLITPAGFLVLPRSMWLTDHTGKSMSWRSAVWRPTDNGVSLVLLHDPRDVDDFDGYTKEFNVTAPLIPTHVTPWYFGASSPGRVGDEPDEWASTTQQVHRQIQAIWRLLQQHLAEVTQQRPPRPAARRAAAAKLPHEHVTIVRLRRPAQDRQPDEPSTVHWSHRWLVGGHWRNQWYPSLGLHRQIWISPYVKGPEDLPLEPNKARIFALVR